MSLSQNKVATVVNSNDDQVRVRFLSSFGSEVLGYDATNDVVMTLTKFQVTIARIISLEMFQTRKSSWPSFVYYTTAQELATDDQDMKVLPW